MNKKLAKESIEWRIISMFIELCIVFWFTGSVEMSLWITAVSFVVKTTAYYFWRKTNNGKHNNTTNKR